MHKLGSMSQAPGHHHGLQGHDCVDVQPDGSNDQISTARALGVQISEEEYIATRADISTKLMQHDDGSKQHKAHYDHAAPKMFDVGVAQTGDVSIRCKMSSICDAPASQCYPGSDGMGCIADPIERREYAVAAIKWAWESYRRCAWGYDELHPISCRGHQWFGLGLSIIDSLDTLVLAGLDEVKSVQIYSCDCSDHTGRPRTTQHLFKHVRSANAFMGL